MTERSITDMTAAEQDELRGIVARLRRDARLTAWERDYIASVANYPLWYTPKQSEIIRRIAKRRAA